VVNQDDVAGAREPEAHKNVERGDSTSEEFEGDYLDEDPNSIGNRFAWRPGDVTILEPGDPEYEDDIDV
jgi:hypothetical protein